MFGTYPVLVKPFLAEAGQVGLKKLKPNSTLMQQVSPLPLLAVAKKITLVLHFLINYLGTNLHFVMG